MKIINIEIQNFKAFKEAQPFSIEGKNILVFGNNGSGKSSFYFALHAFIQSSIKSNEQRQKYFIYDGNESLLNIHADRDYPAYIRITTDNAKVYEFSSKLADGNIDNTNDAIKLSNESCDFMNYRLLNAFSNFRNSQDADLFPVFQNEFFPYWTYGNQSFQEWYDSLLKEIKDLKDQYHASSKADKQRFWRDNAPYGRYLKKLEKFNEQFQTKYRSFVESINDLMRDIFLKNDNVKLFFNDNSYSPLRVVDKNAFGDCWRLELPELIMKITKDDKPVPKPHIFLNEARITGIALSLRFAIFDQKYKGKSDSADDFKLLVLDDLLLSLDMSKRMQVINYITSNKDFKKYQLFILTHDKGFYTILRNNLIETDDDWKCFEFYENNNGTAYKNPIVITSLDALRKAEELLTGQPYAVPPVPPKYDECALYLRKKTEELVHLFYDPTLENLSRYHILETLANSLAGIEKEFFQKQVNSFKHLFLNDNNLSAENIARLKGEVFMGDGTLTREQIASTNTLKWRFLDLLSRFEQQKVAYEKHRLDIVKIAKETDELRNRILNHGAHPTTEPLFGEELNGGIHTIKKFEAELKAKLEWLKTFEMEVLKLKKSS